MNWLIVKVTLIELRVVVLLDNTAFSWMVSDKEYNKVVKSKNYDNNNEVRCFLAYRLANDKYIKYDSFYYQNNNKLINS